MGVSLTEPEPQLLEAAELKLVGSFPSWMDCEAFGRAAAVSGWGGHAAWFAAALDYQWCAVNGVSLNDFHDGITSTAAENLHSFIKSPLHVREKLARRYFGSMNVNALRGIRLPHSPVRGRPRLDVVKSPRVG